MSTSIREVQRIQMNPFHHTHMLSQVSRLISPNTQPHHPIISPFPPLSRSSAKLPPRGVCTNPPTSSRLHTPPATTRTRKEANPRVPVPLMFQNARTKAPPSNFKKRKRKKRHHKLRIVQPRPLASARALFRRADKCRDRVSDSKSLVTVQVPFSSRQLKNSNVGLSVIGSWLIATAGKEDKRPLVFSSVRTLTRIRSSGRNGICRCMIGPSQRWVSNA